MSNSSTRSVSGGHLGGHPQPDFTPTRRLQLAWRSLAFFVFLLACALPAAASAAMCPNEQLRQEDDSTQLAECRAYELVSPPQKSGTAVSLVDPVFGSPSGDAAAFSSTGAFADAPGTTVGSYYAASRGLAGWTTHSLEVAQLNTGELDREPTPGISEDFSTTFQASLMAVAPGAVQGQTNIYLRDNATGGHTLIAKSNDPNGFAYFNQSYDWTYVGGTADFSHLVFDYSLPLLPDSPAGMENLYEWSGGQLHLVNYLPDGSVAPAEPIRGQGFFPVSKDGSRVIFQAGSVLYMRVDNTSTVPISVSQRTGEQSTPQAVDFVGDSADFKRFFFTSAQQLTNDSTASASASAEDLYEFEVQSSDDEPFRGKLTDLTVDQNPSESAAVKIVTEVSEEGTYAYFTAEGALVPGAPATSYGNPDLYVWHQGQGIKFIAQGAITGTESHGQVSPNGLHLAFQSEAKLTPNGCAGCALLYEYDYDTGEVHCVSCTPSGARPTGALEVGGIPYGIGFSAHYPRYMLDNGEVFFASIERLVPQDTNGQYDVYEWRNGQLLLISSGHGNQEASFADVSPDGANVFFRTGQQLVSQDTDGSTDLYDARVDGGFPAAPPAVGPCTGTGCQGVPSAPPIFATPPSVTFEGVGNFEVPTKAAAKSAPKSLTRAQQLARSLKACKHKPKKQHPACEARARKKYDKTASVRRAKRTATNSNRRGK